MYGSFFSNLPAIAYYLYFQLLGIFVISVLFHQENTVARFLLGSVAGSLLFTWLPVLFAFFFDFTFLSHMLALTATFPILAAALVKAKARRSSSQSFGSSLRSVLNRHIVFFILFALFMAFWCFLLHTHTILPDEYGGITTGQCTYGDMNMHLGFITSLAVQGSFPPDYSIMPGVRLSYPFLSDSISSGLLVLGASLRIAYILPMIFAMAQIFCTVYLFACNLFQSVPKALLTLLLFFCNGGFGFIYFINWTKNGSYAFSDIFTGFYKTPTNLINENIRWVNVIADMFLPQRATLFGYAVLFPALLLLYRAVFNNQKEYFPLAGFFVAALPMIHTHSFLSAGIISAVWMLMWLRKKTAENAGSCHARWILAAFVACMCLIQFLNHRSYISSDTLLLTGVSIFVAAVIYGVRLLVSYIRRFGWRELLCYWGVYLALILLFAVPQLLYWTFGQVSQGGFVRGCFNWGNQGDFYPWFYIKNLGIVLLLIVGGICACNQKTCSLFLPTLFLWWVSELIVFTPNVYDNNKILYVAYLLLCFTASDYGVELYRKLKGFPGRRLFAAIFLFLAGFSAALTLGREAVSEYQLYSPAQTALAAYVEENTQAGAVFLTNARHNNEISSLTGRSIVCGSDTFLYFHGLDTSGRRQDVQLMYESPLEHPELFEKYNVSHIVISPYERNSFSINEEAFRQEFTELFSYGDTVLYLVK